MVIVLALYLHFFQMESRMEVLSLDRSLTDAENMRVLRRLDPSAVGILLTVSFVKVYAWSSEEKTWVSATPARQESAALPSAFVYFGFDGFVVLGFFVSFNSMERRASSPRPVSLEVRPSVRPHRPLCCWPDSHLLATAGRHRWKMLVKMRPRYAPQKLRNVEGPLLVVERCASR